jgi:FtsH-binding integral membrane protein
MIVLDFNLQYMFGAEEQVYGSHGHTVDVTKPGFLSGAFSFFALALLVSALGVWVGFTYAPQLFVSQGTMIFAIILELILAFTAHIWSQKYPLGYWMFALFAFISGLTLVPILALAGATAGLTLIFRALIATVATFGAAALYALVTPRNLLGMGGFLSISLIGLIIISVIHLFIPWSNTMEIVVSGFTVVLFAGFTMYNVQALQRGPGINPLMAGIQLYLSFINLFIGFLRLLLAFHNRD